MRLAAALAIGVAACFASPPAGPKPLKVGPVAYFEAHCSRCHGPQGSMYPMDSLRRLTPAELRSKIAEMARGPGQAPLAGRDLDAQVGLHAAFARGLPFLSLTSESGGRLGGEALRAKVVTARLGKQTIAAKVGDGHWEVAVPISWLQKPFLIVADGRASMTPESAFTSDVGIAHTSRKPGRGSRRL